MEVDDLPFPFTSEQLAALRHDAHVLIQRATDHEGRLEALVSATEGDLRYAEAAASNAADLLDVADIRYLLAAQFERSAAGAAAVRHLLAGAHQQHVAADRLLMRLDAFTVRAHPSPKAVLVVDDYPEIREVLARVLVDAGFVVRTAANGL